MPLTSKKKAQRAKSQYLAEDVGGRELADAFAEQYDKFYSLNNLRPDYQIEQLLLKQQQFDVEHLHHPVVTLPKFSPSSLSKCDLELYRTIHGLYVPKDDTFPYHNRWTRNATAVHAAIQRDLLYMEKVLDKPCFTVKRMPNGLPSWESAMYRQMEIKHNGQRFVITGMADGMLQYSKTGETVIFEIKTKSTTIAAVGDYKMKYIQDNHVLQGVAYSILFMGDPYEDRDDKEIFLYESVAKDFWGKKADARKDYRTFQQTITLEDRMAVLDRLADIVAMKEEPSHDDCTNYFCPFQKEV